VVHIHTVRGKKKINAAALLEMTISGALNPTVEVLVEG